jgi:hypothetical protein
LSLSSAIHSGPVAPAQAFASERGEFLDEDDREAPGECESGERRNEDVEVWPQVLAKKGSILPRPTIPQFFSRSFFLPCDAFHAPY